jgi:penicillin G amidase
MKWLKIILLVLLLVMVVLIVGGFLIYRDVTQSAVPQHSGEIEVAGLNDIVEIFRDEWGVPYVFASNPYDLFFAQGYAQAQDRWWQMEFFRHTGRGAIQELTGRSSALMGTDIFLRTLGFREVVERELQESYGDDMLMILQAFSDGINAYVQGRSPGALALEYNLLRLSGVDIEVSPWTPEDSLLWGKVMALQLSRNQNNERLLSRLYDHLDDELVDQWFVPWPYGEKPTILWPEDLPITQAPASATNTGTSARGAGIVGLATELAGNFVLEDSPLPLMSGPGVGSNNWVVHGDLTESGMPLLANDMHLGIQMPSIWYEIGLHCRPVTEDCPYEVAGFTFSPVPGVIAGHNANIAWGLTNLGPDTQDLYRIRVNPENNLQYEWNGDWRDMTVRDETLYFGDGSEPVTFQVRVTHFGPIINDNQLDDDGDLTGFNNEDPLALRWTALDPGTIFDAVLSLNRAANWDDFREALSYWDTPSQNIVYADTQGNIGYQTPGRIPIRAADHSGLLPIPGWTDEYEWRGFIPFDYLPRVFNPERGYIGTGNQALVPLEYYDWLADELGDEFGPDANYVISRIWAYGYRGERIYQLLEDLAPHNADTFRQMHGDNYIGSAAEILPFLANIAIDDDELASVRDWLLEWDYHADIDSPHAALYMSFWAQLVSNIFNDRFGDHHSASGAGSEPWAVYLLMQDPENAWWNDTTTGAIETRDDIVIRSLREGHDRVAEILGDNHHEWRWGALHTTTFVSNPLGQSGIGLIEDVVNRGPVETAGSGIALNATGWSAASGDFSTNTGPSQRAIYDLGDWSESLTMHTTGQGGHPYGRHYDDMIDPWRSIEYHPMLWTRDQIEAAATNRLVLTPAE